MKRWQCHSCLSPLFFAFILPRIGGKDMCNKFTAGCFLFLTLFLLTASGCWWGGGGTMHVPRDLIRCGKPWIVAVMYTNDPRDWRVNLKKEAGKFMVHYRVSSSDEYVAVPMVIEKLDLELGRAYLKAEMPPVSCDRVGDYVMYYYDHIASYCGDCYNSSRIYKVPVIERD